ncbi:MAG: hypothetical protein ACRDY3_06335, partial [Acidimicrobiales bacterium]
MDDVAERPDPKEGGRRKFSPRRGLSLGLAVATMFALTVVASVTSSAVLTSPALAATSCVPSTSASISYRVVVTPAPAQPTSFSIISGVVVSGLSAGCDTETAR